VVVLLYNCIPKQPPWESSQFAVQVEQTNASVHLVNCLDMMCHKSPACQCSCPQQPLQACHCLVLPLCYTIAMTLPSRATARPAWLFCVQPRITSLLVHSRAKYQLTQHVFVFVHGMPASCCCKQPVHLGQVASLLFAQLSRSPALGHVTIFFVTCYESLRVQQ
jgi:hypothetical protein